MNHIVSQSDRLFVDRLMSNRPDAASRVSSLHLLCQDQTDYTEAAIRLFLMLCIPVSLLLCGMRVSATSDHRPVAQIEAPTWTAACLHLSLPKVQINAAFR